jgi:ADP-ribose pyrophosphatase
MSDPDRKIIRCDCASNSRYIGLWNLEYEEGDKARKWTFASRKPTPEFIESPKADAVVVVVTCDKRLVVTREFRAPLWGYEYGFPAGLLNTDEDPVTAARRELKEETGLYLTNVDLISPPLYSSAGLSDEAVCMVFGRADGVVSSDYLEETEDITTLLLSAEEAWSLCVRKDIKISAKAWPILFQYGRTGEAW